MASRRTFDELISIVPESSADPKPTEFRAETPKELLGSSGGIYGGFLLALATRVCLRVANDRGHPHLMTLQLDVFVAIPPGELRVVVDVLRSTRRLMFMRMNVYLADGKLAMAGQASCGTLVAEGSQNGSAPGVEERLPARYCLASSLALAPSLKNFASGAGTVNDVVLKAMDLPPADKWGGGGFMKLSHAKEAVDYIRNVIKKGPEAVKKETWEKVDAMPRFLEHPDGKDVDEVYAAFCADHYPVSTILHFMLGPNVNSVTISISLQFYKPFIGTPHVYMVSDMPAEDVPTTKDSQASVAYSEARLYTPDGRLLGMMRQSRVTVGSQQPPVLAKQLEKIWGLEKAKL